MKDLKCYLVEDSGGAEYYVAAEQAIVAEVAVLEDLKAGGITDMEVTVKHEIDPAQHEVFHEEKGRSVTLLEVMQDGVTGILGCSEW